MYCCLDFSKLVVKLLEPLGRPDVTKTRVVRFYTAFLPYHLYLFAFLKPIIFCYYKYKLKHFYDKYEKCCFRLDVLVLIFLRWSFFTYYFYILKNLIYCFNEHKKFEFFTCVFQFRMLLNSKIWTLVSTRLQHLIIKLPRLSLISIEFKNVIIIVLWHDWSKK